MGHIKLVTAVVLVLLAVVFGGCSGGSCGSCKSDACMKFWNAKDPCADGACSKQERVAYAMLGYECAKARGMVAISPKYGLPALECPIELKYDCTAKCPPACYEVPGQEQEIVTAERGFLLTVFDTANGPQYVIIETEKKFDPRTKLEEVGVKAEEVSQMISQSKGKVAVYLTEFPLVVPTGNQQSRQLNEAEVSVIRSKLAVMGKSLGDVSFIRWK